jgi:hypothetical protein
MGKVVGRNVANPRRQADRREPKKRPPSTEEERRLDPLPRLTDRQ